jgi:hypothetical protein
LSFRNDTVRDHGRNMSVVVAVAEVRTSWS